jgi:hypothetical protein
METKSHVERCECEKSQQGYRAYIQTYHQPSGLPWFEDQSTHYYSLKAAREVLKEQQAHEASYAR